MAVRNCKCSKNPWNENYSENLWTKAAIRYLRDIGKLTRCPMSP
jgi:hypothetical protein